MKKLAILTLVLALSIGGVASAELSLQSIEMAKMMRSSNESLLAVLMRGVPYADDRSLEVTRQAAQAVTGDSSQVLGLPGALKNVVGEENANEMMEIIRPAWSERIRAMGGTFFPFHATPEPVSP